MDLFDVQELAKALMAEHGLIEKGWTFKWDRAKKRAGSCQYKAKNITLSMPLMKLWDEPEVTDTILHEIAHALAGHKAGHGTQWKMAARTIGAKPERCYNPERDGLEVPEGVWESKCPSGRHTARQHRAPLRVHSCSSCAKMHYGKSCFAWKFVHVWTKNGVVVDPMTISDRYAAEFKRMVVKYGPPVKREW